MRRCSKALPMVASEVLSGASLVATTLTVSVTSPTSSLTSSSTGVSTSARTSLTEAFLKPAASASTRYVPGGTAWKT
jgi:hypothetical protein